VALSHGQRHAGSAGARTLRTNMRLEWFNELKD
jgi:hypothetical protein